MFLLDREVFGGLQVSVFSGVNHFHGRAKQKRGETIRSQARKVCQLFEHGSEDHGYMATEQRSIKIVQVQEKIVHESTCSIKVQSVRVLDGILLTVASRQRDSV